MNCLRMRTMIAVSMLIMCILVRIFWGAGTDKLQSCFLPSDRTVTETAFLALMEDLSLGENLGVAMDSFCRSVLNGEN